MVIARGEVVWVGFGSPRGSEPAKIRSAVVMPDDWLLAPEIATVVAVPLTSITGLHVFPGNVLVSQESSGLGEDSVDAVSQIGPVSREFLEPQPVGHLHGYPLREIGDGIRLVTGL